MKIIKILLVNKFLYPKGGAEISTLTTGKILESNDHEVEYWGMDHPSNLAYHFEQYFVSQVDFEGANSLFSKAITAMNILYSFEAKKKFSKLLEKFHPDVIHLNNFAHQISPSVLDVIKKYRIPVVMTMRDYKMVCPIYSMLSKNEICERCKGGRFYHCGINRCTKDSFFKSFLNVAEMYLHHKVLHIYDQIDLYISPSHFLKEKVLEMGLKGEVDYLSNCVDPAVFKPRFESKENSVVYVGRLSREKGLETLINAVKNISGLFLKIIGNGPLKECLQKKVMNENIYNVKFLGYKTGQDLHNEIRNSMFLVIPSEWYENNPRTVIEAFALGKPALGARIGGIPELVKDWKTGLCFRSGDVADLKSKVGLMLENREKIPAMGRNARCLVEEDLNSDVYYRNLMKIYDRAAVIAKSRDRR